MIRLIRLRISIDFAEAAIRLVPRAVNQHQSYLSRRAENGTHVGTRLAYRTSHK